jgi:hypothetical protein
MQIRVNNSIAYDIKHNCIRDKILCDSKLYLFLQQY